MVSLSQQRPGGKDLYFKGMEREQARQEVRRNWRSIILNYTTKAKKRVEGKDTYICPLCGHGKGGDGLKNNPKSKDGNGIICFGCGFSGDIIDLIMQVQGIDNNEAFKLAAGNLGIAIDPYRNGDLHDRAQAPTSPAKSKGIEMPVKEKAPSQGEPQAEELARTDYTPYYKECAQRINDPAAVSYLQARGIAPETAATYHLGYDPAWISPGAVRKLRAKGNDWTPPAVRALILPISKNHYIARTVDAKDAEHDKKNETGGEGVGIFNMRVIKTGKVVFITEGVFDALSVIQCGGESIALNSTQYVNTFIKKLKECVTNCRFVISTDNDDPGQAAAQKLHTELQALNIPHITANIAGDKKDANEQLVADRPALERAIQAAIKEVEALPEPSNVPDQGQDAPENDFFESFYNDISGNKYEPYKTGIPFFDNLLDGGPVRESLLLLLAAPASGKTTLCQQIAESMAINGKPVIYIALEMGKRQMIAKSISASCTRAGERMATLDVLQGYRWTDKQREAVKAAIDNYKKTIDPNLKYPDSKYLRNGYLEDISECLDRAGKKAKSLKEEAPVVILDYLHLVSLNEKADNQEIIKRTMKTLKNYALEYNTVAIAISATNRDSNKAGRITMESGRDSSNIEYTGDYILSLNYYQVDKGTAKVSDNDQMDILKSRPWKQMIIRTLKTRLCSGGRCARVYFDAAGNRFYPENAAVPDGVIMFDQADPELYGAGKVIEDNPYTSDNGGNAPISTGSYTGVTPKAGKRR